MRRLVRSQFPVLNYHPTLRHTESSTSQSCGFAGRSQESFPLTPRFAVKKWACHTGAAGQKHHQPPPNKLAFVALCVLQMKLPFHSLLVGLGRRVSRRTGSAREDEGKSASRLSPRQRRRRQRTGRAEKMGLRFIIRVALSTRWAAFPSFVGKEAGLGSRVYLVVNSSSPVLTSCVRSIRRVYLRWRKHHL